MKCIVYDPALGFFTNSIEAPGVRPFHMTARCFSEEQPNESLIRRLWGYFQSGVFTGIIPLVLNLVDARELARTAIREKWSPAKCIKEVRRAAYKAKTAPKVIGTVSGVLSGVIYGGSAAVGAATGGAAVGGVVLVGAGVFLLCLLAGALMGWVGSIFSKRGFVRIMEGYLGKKLMHAVNNGSELESIEDAKKEGGKERELPSI